MQQVILFKAREVCYFFTVQNGTKCVVVFPIKRPMLHLWLMMKSKGQKSEHTPDATFVFSAASLAELHFMWRKREYKKQVTSFMKIILPSSDLCGQVTAAYSWLILERQKCWRRKRVAGTVSASHMCLFKTPWSLLFLIEVKNKNGEAFV